MKALFEEKQKRILGRFARPKIADVVNSRINRLNRTIAMQNSIIGTFPTRIRQKENEILELKAKLNEIYSNQNSKRIEACI